MARITRSAGHSRSEPGTSSKRPFGETLTWTTARVQGRNGEAKRNRGARAAFTRARARTHARGWQREVRTTGKARVGRATEVAEGTPAQQTFGKRASAEVRGEVGLAGQERVTRQRVNQERRWFIAVARIRVRVPAVMFYEERGGCAHVRIRRGVGRPARCEQI